MTNTRETVSHRVVNLVASAPEVKVAGETRTITGVIASIGAPSTTQRIVLQAGSLRARSPLDRVKLLRDHDTKDPVGFLRTLSEDGLTATFYIPEGPNGDRALAEAQNGLRNGLSVGFNSRDAFEDKDGNVQIPTADLYEVSLVAVPDMQDAQVTTVVMSAQHREEPMTEQLPESTPVEDRAVTLTTTEVQPSVELTAGPVPVPASTPFISVQQRPLSLRDVALRVSSAFNDLTSDANRVRNVQLAITDITTSQDVGNSFIGRADWIGELWTASQFSRPWIDSIGPVASLDTVKRRGWRWTTRPTVAEYLGNKAEVPSSTAQTEAAEYTAFRVAGGWDIDRIFLDLASDPGYLESFWQAATDMYKGVSDSSIRSRVVALATDKTSSTTGGNSATVFGTTIVQLLKQIVRDGRNVPGANINRIWLDPILFAELEDFPVGGTNGLPLWLSQANIGMNIREGQADVSGLQIGVDPSLAARTALYYDNRALTVREKQPFQLKTFDVAHAGVDLGFYSYLMLENPDPRLVMKRTRPAS